MEKYIKPILKDGKCFVLTYDQGFVHGVSDFNEINQDINYIFELAIKGGFTGLVLHKGIAEYFRESKYFSKIPLIIKLNSNTILPKEGDPDTARICSVAYAKKLGAVAVGYTIYLGAEGENEMFEEFSAIQEEARALNMGVIAWIYIRGKNVVGQPSDLLTQYATRVGLELGADMVKVKYGETCEGFEKAVNFAKPMKVGVSGEHLIDEDAFLENTREIMSAGGCGLLVGRNIWQRPDALEFTKKVRDIIFG